MTYNVFGYTLNLALSIYLSQKYTGIFSSWKFWKCTWNLQSILEIFRRCSSVCYRYDQLFLYWKGVLHLHTELPVEKIWKCPAVSIILGLATLCRNVN